MHCSYMYLYLYLYLYSAASMLYTTVYVAFCTHACAVVLAYWYTAHIPVLVCFTLVYCSYPSAGVLHIDILVLLIILYQWCATHWYMYIPGTCISQCWCAAHWYTSTAHIPVVCYTLVYCSYPSAGVLHIWYTTHISMWVCCTTAYRILERP